MVIRKFYYYNIWAEDKNGNRPAIDNVFNSDLFTEDNFHINSEEDKHYFTRFQTISPGNFHGFLMRTKDEEGFIRMNEDMEIGFLSDDTDGEGRTGSIDRDFVNCGLRKGYQEIQVLLEVGYQTPGILKLKEYIQQHILNGDVHAIRHESVMPELNDDKMQRLLESNLQKSKISFKRNPKSIPGADLDETMDNLAPDDYRITIETSLEQGADEEQNVRQYLKGVTPLIGGNPDDIRETIRQFDFPRLMNTFRITGFDAEVDEEVEENLASTSAVEKIDVSDYGLFDERLGDRLCSELEENA